MKNKTIRLSDVSKSNDRDEIFLLWNKYQEYIDNNCNNESAKKFLKSEIEKQLDATWFLSMSFSEDSDSLHMWSNYAKSGVAIGFNRNKLLELSKRLMPFIGTLAMHKVPFEDMTVKFRKIVYFSKETMDEYIRRQCEGIEFVIDKFGQIFYDAPFSKNNFWEAEREWRMLVPLFKRSPSDDYFEGNITQLQSEGIIIPERLELKNIPNKMSEFRLCCDVPITTDIIDEIIVGPNSILMKKDIVALLELNGFCSDNINVGISSGSYRDFNS